MAEDNPFLCSKHASYNHIKRNRAIRSEKKLTEAHVPLLRESRSHFKTEIRALLDSTAPDPVLLKDCIQHLKHELQRIKTSPQRRASEPHRPLTKKQANASGRTKTMIEEQSRRPVSKSLQLMRRETGLIDLQAARNQVKRQKQWAERRIPTEQSNLRYQSAREQGEGVKSRKNRYSSEVKLRSSTEEVIPSGPPDRSYHHSSPKKITFNRTVSQKPVLPDNDLVDHPARHHPPNTDAYPTKPTQVDNNQKIADLSTIAKQKETLNFLGESCLGLRDELSPARDPHSLKLLQFVDWRTKELKSVFSGSKQRRRKGALERLSKIFPKGFFN